MIREGDRFPSVKLKMVSAGETRDVDTAQLLACGRTVLFTVPGAFTPTCSNNHLPGFIAAAAQFYRFGVDRIICASVNDHHVVKAWAESQHALNDLSFFADFDASLAKATGLSQDRAAVGLGLRFVRTAMIVENATVQHLFIDDVPGEVSSSGALSVLEVFKRQKVANAN